MTTTTIERKYRWTMYGDAYGFQHNDEKRMCFVTWFSDPGSSWADEREGWKYGCVSIEEVKAAIERVGDDRGDALDRFYVWVSDIAHSSYPYRTREAAIQAALKDTT